MPEQPATTEIEKTAAEAHHRPVLVVDFGAQYAQLIARRVREANAFSLIVSHDLSAEQIKAHNPVGIIFSGGPASVNVQDAPSIDAGVYDLGVPILGICYGAQLIATQLGGEVARFEAGEYGRTILNVHRGQLHGESSHNSQRTVWMSHFDAISKAPEGFQVTASTANAPVAAFESDLICGTQYHPEVSHCEGGQQLIEAWLDRHDIARDWTSANIIDEQVALIREQVGDAKVICGLSGGVDSAVAAAMVHKAIGPQLTCVFIDTGLMRLNEGEQVVETFQKTQGIELVHVRAADDFFESLQGVTEPEAKRKAIGEKFIRCFERAAGGIEDASFLVQGTLYPDVVESGSAHGSVIKSHHNVGGLPDDMYFELIEPLRDLFKDEVRRVGTALGLPDEIVWRQPFPGPGLGVRIIGEVTPDKVEVLQYADAIVREVLKQAGLERKIFQSFAVLADIKTVGVMGDERTYGYPIIVRAVTSEDVMTADWARIPYEVLDEISSRIINEVAGVNRVAYDITSKPPGTIEWE